MCMGQVLLEVKRLGASGAIGLLSFLIFFLF